MAGILQHVQHLKIELKDIREATNNFKDKPIGGGGFGKVYEGEVSHSKGRSMAAIKRLNPRDGQGRTEFHKEIEALSRYKHANLISLLGFCYQDDEMILVYEHAFNKSLDKHLHSPDLTWAQRLSICIGVAKGLSYLHDPRGTHQRLIHCDIKSANILLDDQWIAKISDFGLSIMGPANELHSVIFTHPAGTSGYCDPVYQKTHSLTKESDVYSFGVVLIEVLCGALCYTCINDSFQHLLVSMWIESYKHENLNQNIFKSPKIEPMNQSSLKIFSDIAYRCLKESREDRPKMAEVVTELETALRYQQGFDHESSDRKHSDIVVGDYVQYVLDEGKAIATKTRQRKLYTNSKSEGYGSKRTMWSHIMFDHPSTFDTLAMDPNKKKEILDDLLTFSKSKDYYKKVGKSWKRRYLLYGPPGTGKSSLIAAMANLLDYDIYDLELSSVSDNTDLRKLLIETSSKSIIVIEDIDCLLDLTGQRKKKKEDNKADQKDPIRKMEKNNEKKESVVTFSWFLNFVDGLWSACGSERLIIFTTNHVEKLDPALITIGRMDKHIQMSYCCFETFKVLAKNYLDLESHELFVTIGRLLEETNMTPADVAENLMPKSAEEDAESCLNRLISSLEYAKEEARLKVVEG